MKKSPVSDMVFYLLGERAAVMQSSGALDVACQHRIWAVAQQLRGRGCYQEVVPGMNNLSVVLFFNPLQEILHLVSNCPFMNSQ